MARQRPCGVLLDDARHAFRRDLNPSTSFGSRISAQVLAAVAERGVEFMSRHAFEAEFDARVSQLAEVAELERARHGSFPS